MRAIPTHLSGCTVEVILPCLDEAAALPAVFRRIPSRYRITLVDNNSQDGSAQVAAALGARVLSEVRRGYGAAVHTGLAASTADVLAVMDCDGSIDAAELAPLIAAVIAGECDLATGRRRPAEPGSWPLHARLGNRFLAAVMSRSTPHLAVKDLGPVRVARRTELLGLDIGDRRSGYPVETLIKAANAGWRIREFDLTYRRRAVGTRSKVSGSVRGTITATRDILSSVRRHRVVAV